MIFEMFYTHTVLHLAWGVNTRKWTISFQHFNIPSYGVINVSALAEAQSRITITLASLLWIVTFTYTNLFHRSTFVSHEWHCVKLPEYKCKYFNLSSSVSLAEELYQKVKRLFGDPHQATEDLKAEVILTSNLLTFVFDVPKLMALTEWFPICFPR